MIWQLQTAKQKFSELVERALTEGPQVVTRRGKAAVVVIDVEDYRRLDAEGASFKRFLAGPPYVDELKIERSDLPARQIDL